MLSSSPYDEWTIDFSDVKASFVYRPKAFTEREQYTDVFSYIEHLTPSLHYFIVENQEFIDFDIHSIEQRETGFYMNDLLLGTTTEQVIERIYCDLYENPFAHFSVMVLLEELEEAALSEDPVLRVRAFNTMFEIDRKAAPIVNRVLRIIQVEEHEEMLMQVIAEHFEKIGLLDAEVKERWLS
ncbi:hypothetical protein LZ480_07975 [Solibacillus sp. MA9]|uniref:Immunity protein 30 domain-containing protein n=1 Tax=Solibacillus palustris TaxID=2908203 RepID=A0ABS9UC05_9BACL|nr:hypothetical protein [Solibacillus sp. MA9]MCH7321829.1 hypothetical protein [Solibacillus sp. MA9]